MLVDVRAPVGIGVCFALQAIDVPELCGRRMGVQEVVDPQ